MSILESRIKITKNGKVVTVVSGEKVSTQNYTISENGKEIFLEDGSSAKLNGDKDILTFYNDDSEMIFEKE